MQEPDTGTVDVELNSTDDASNEGKSPDGGTGQAAAEPRGRQYSEAYVKQLRSEGAAHRNKIVELEERLQEITDRDKTEQERVTERLAAAERAAQESSARLIRYEVAAEHGLDMQAAQFLTGTTREEIELRAEELGKLLKDRAKPTTAGFDGGARTTAPETKSPEEAHNDFLMRALGRTST